MVTYQMTLSFVHIYNFVAFIQVNYGMTKLLDYSLLLLAITLLIVHQVIQKIMSSLQIREFTGDLR